MAHRVPAEAEIDLLEIWGYVALESNNPETADRLIDSIATRFLLLARNPQMGRRRDYDLQPGCGASLLVNT